MFNYRISSIVFSVWLETHGVCGWGVSENHVQLTGSREPEAHGSSAWVSSSKSSLLLQRPNWCGREII